MTHPLTVVVGVPPEVESPFRTAFAKLALQEHIELAILSACDIGVPYTEDYAERVYRKLVSKLKARQARRRSTRETLLAETRLIILFLHKPDESHTVLFDRFGVEAFVTPLVLPTIADMPLETGGQRRHVTRQLIRRARSAIRHALQMLDAIDEELSRENKTCLLLPPKTFGKGFRKVLHRVLDAAASREDTTSFVRSLRTLPIDRQGKYYRGARRLVFKSPSKAGPRHGLPPAWEDGHESSCVIRGRLRFGAPYDPHFHYDCPIPPDSPRRFPDCHKPEELPSNREHVNCAPNDGIR